MATTNAGYLSQEREIQRILQENQALRRDVETLQGRLEPLENYVGKMKQQLKERDRLFHVLARNLRHAILDFQNEVCDVQEEKPQVNLGRASTYTALVAEVEQGQTQF